MSPGRWGIRVQADSSSDSKGPPAHSEQYHDSVLAMRTEARGSMLSARYYHRRLLSMTISIQSSWQVSCSCFLHQVLTCCRWPSRCSVRALSKFPVHISSHPTMREYRWCWSTIQVCWHVWKHHALLLPTHSHLGRHRCCSKRPRAHRRCSDGEGDGESSYSVYNIPTMQ